MRPLFFTIALALSASLPAQDLDIAPGYAVPDVLAKRLKRTYGDQWRLPGYRMRHVRKGWAYATGDGGGSYLIIRYPETQVLQGRFTLDPTEPRLRAEGPAAFLTPDGRQYRGGAFRQNLRHGPWLSISVDTALGRACPALSAASTPEQALAAVRACYPEPAVRHRISLREATYRDGELDGVAYAGNLAGDTNRVLRYRAGVPIGEERLYDTAGVVTYRIAHSATGSDTVYNGPPKPAFKLVETMPLFDSRDCPPVVMAQDSSYARAKRCAERAMLTYIYDNVRYPRRSRREGTDGRAVVSFVIERDGSITNVRNVTFVSAGIDAEARRVVGEMPRWRPSYQGGEPVRVSFVLPIEFRLE